MSQAASSPSNIYQPITIQVSNAAAGQKIAVQVKPNGASIGWSTGPAFQNIDGISVTAQSGSLPLTQFNANSGEVIFLTSSSGGGGGALTFRLSAYLVAASTIETFYLVSSSDPGIEVTAGIGNSVPQVVNQSATLFSWYPV